MARHSHPRPRTTPRAACRRLRDLISRYWPETQYHRTHPAFMAYAYCSALAALLVVSWVSRIVT